MRFAVSTAGKPQSKHRRREGPDRPGTPPQTSHFRSPSRSPAALVCGPAHPPLTLSHLHPMMTAALCASVIIVPRPLARADGRAAIIILRRARSSTPTAYHTTLPSSHALASSPPSTALRLSRPSDCLSHCASGPAPLVLRAHLLHPGARSAAADSDGDTLGVLLQRPAPSTVFGSKPRTFRERGNQV